MAHPEIVRTLADPSVSFWVKDALKTAVDRDPLDCLDDAELLVEIFTKVCDSALTDARLGARKL